MYIYDMGVGFPGEPWFTWEMNVVSRFEHAYSANHPLFAVQPVPSLP